MQKQARSQLGRVLLLALLLGACKKDRSAEPTPDPDVRLPLPELALPALHCEAELAVRGECARDQDCGAAACVLDPATSTRDRESPALSCGAAVGTLSERERCSAGDECESGLCALAGVCLAPCAGASDCEPGQVCRPIEARIDEGLAPVRACTRAIALPADVALGKPSRVPALSPETVGTVTSSGGTGTSIVYLKAECEAQPIVWSLHARPDGQELFSLEKLLEGKISPNPVAPTSQTPLLTVLVPNNPAVDAASQGYELGILVDRDTSADVVVASRADAGSVLDLNVFYVGGGEMEVPGGYRPGDERVAAMFDELGERYAEIGITLGQRREYDVTGALREELSVLDTEEVLDELGNVVDITLDGLERLFELSAGVDDGGINIFLVSDMDFILGVSGGIPGALGVHGTVTSGVAVALDSTEAPVSVLMHEISHQMGLYHTSELDGRLVEPLGDTPACLRDRDGDANGVLAPSECRGAGAENLMFWAGTGSELSAMQREVLKRSLILR
jgi:hypothetical protein